MFKPTLSGGSAITIADEHIFADTAARDAYFVTHFTELVNNLYIYITGTSSLQQYKTASSSWLDMTPALKGQDGATGADGESINVTVSATEPSSASNGDIWVDTDETLSNLADNSVLWNGIARPTFAGCGGRLLTLNAAGTAFEFPTNVAIPGTPTASTASINTNTTQLATTAHVYRYRPQPGSVFFPTYLYTSGGAKKAIYTYQYHSQVSAVNGDYFIIPVYCSGSETIIDLNLYKMSDGGKFDLYINDVLDSSGYDGYASSPAYAVTSISLTQAVTAGWNTIKIVLNGTNGSSYYFKTGGVRLR